MGAPGEVENTETAVPQPDSRIGVGALRVGAAMGQGAGHRRQRLFGRIRLVAKGGKTGYAAHRVEDSGTKDGVSSEEVGVKRKAAWMSFGIGA